MIVAATITILGIAIGIGVTQRAGLRMGGVVVIPLLAVYSLYSFEALPLFVVCGIIAYYLVNLIRSRTLIHGRQLLLTSIGVGAITPLTMVALFDMWNVSDSVAEIGFFGTILPGIAAYNYHKLDLEERRTDLLVSFGTLVALLALGAVLVNPTFATRLDPSLTTILFTPASDIAQYRRAVRGAVAPTTAFDRGRTLVLLAVGLLVSEAAHARWGVRMGGLIAIPLLVVLSLTNIWAVAVYLVGLGVVYAAITALNALTQVYGRVLLSCGVIASMGYGALVAAYAPVLSGFALYFTVLLTGIGAYNFHRVAPAERLESVVLSAGLFASLCLASQGIVETTRGGALTAISAAELVVLLGLISLSVHCTYHLEKRRRSVAKQHSRTVIP